MSKGIMMRKKSSQKSKPKPKRGSRTSVRTPRKPRTASLPGMEDHAIPALEKIAQEYADIRDQRMELTLQERALKTTAIAAMHKHGRTSYEHDGVTIRLVPGEEKLKVQIREHATEEDDETPLEELLAERRVETELLVGDAEESA
jgi:hypothetical protein